METDKSLDLPRIEPRILNCPPRSLNTIPPMLSWLLIFICCRQKLFFGNLITMNCRHSTAHLTGVHCQKLERQMSRFSVLHSGYIPTTGNGYVARTQPFSRQNLQLWNLTILFIIHRLQRSDWLYNHWPWSGYTFHELITACLYLLRGTCHKR